MADSEEEEADKDEDERIQQRDAAATHVASRAPSSAADPGHMAADVFVQVLSVVVGFGRFEAHMQQAHMQQAPHVSDSLSRNLHCCEIILTMHCSYMLLTVSRNVLKL